LSVVRVLEWYSNPLVSSRFLILVVRVSEQPDN
jgi:hypothetical protein